MNSKHMLHVTLTLICLVPVSGLSQTPGGDTPANERVCDPLQGGTPGLYGLCVAYCEAQDLHAATGNPPSGNILEIYNKRKKNTDPAMPCVQDPCPCWSEEDLDIALPTLACTDLNDDDDPTIDGVSIFGPEGGAANNARVFVFPDFETDLCFFIVQQSDLPISGIRREQFIAKEQGAICEASARTHAASLGVACESP